MPDRYGNPHFTDEQQIGALVQHMRLEGFEGSTEEKHARATAWWWGDWTGHRCPSLDEAQAFLAQRSAEAAEAR